MKERKYRVWDKTLKYMYYPDLTFYNNRMALDISGYKFFKDAQSQENRQYCEDNFIYLEYIGKKDKNGKSIYEEDIIMIPGNYGGDHFYGDTVAIVKWDDDDCGFYAYDTEDKYGVVFQNFCWEDVRIMGNTFENQELLEHI